MSRFKESAVKRRERSWGTFQVSTNSVGSFTFQLSVTDAGGLRSNQLNGLFQVIADSSLAAVVTATGMSPASLTSANGSLYWSETGEAVLRSIPASRGGATVLGGRAGTLYWMDNFFATPGAIRSVPTTGGMVTTVVSSLVSDANTFAVDDTFVYYATANFPYNSPTTDALVAAPLQIGPCFWIESSGEHRLGQQKRVLDGADSAGYSQVE